MKKFTQRISLLLLLSFSTGGALADMQAVRQLTSLLENTHSYQASFRQNTLDQSGTSIQSFDGQMLVKRPGLFYWHVNPPLEQLVISDGINLWVYDPDLEQAVKQKVDQRVSQTPALLLSGQVDTLEKSFDISMSNGDAGLQTFTLIPKGQDSLFEQLKLTFVDKLLVQMHMIDALGQRSSLEFLDVKINPGIDSQLFTFTPPKGVDVIEQ